MNETLPQVLAITKKASDTVPGVVSREEGFY